MISRLTCCQPAGEARLFGAQHVGLTGGEPRLYPQFERMKGIILEVDYKLSFASNA